MRSLDCQFSVCVRSERAFCMRFSCGDPIPWFSARTHSTDDFQFSAAGGRYVILSFLGSATRPDSRQVITDVEASLRDFDDDRLCFFGVTIDPQDISSGRLRELLPGVRYFQDFSGYISRSYGALPRELSGTNPLTDYRPFSLLLDTRTPRNSTTFVSDLLRSEHLHT